MLYVSIILHGLFFAIPGSSEEEIPEELEEEQEIEITMLSPIVEPEPEPEPVPPEPPPQPAPQPAATPAPAPQPQAPPPEPKPEPEPTQPETSEPETTSDESKTTADTTQAADPSEPPPYDPSSDRDAITNSLTNVQGYFQAQADQLPLFLDDSATNLFLENGIPRQGIQGFAVLNDVKLEGGGGSSVASTFDPDVHIPLQAGMTANPLSQGYGGGRLYEIKTAEGEPVFYANAVPSKSGGSSTILFLWTYNPNMPPSQASN